MNNDQKQPLLSPILRWFLLAMILANIGGTMHTMLLPVYLTELGASVGQVGLVFTLTSIVILILQVFGGWISDSIGRLRAIAIGSVGGIIGFAFLVWAPSWQWMLLALSIAQIPYALVGPSFSAFIAENSTEKTRGRVYGITGTIYQVVGVIGPPLGGFLAGAYSFKVMLLVAGIFYTIAAILRIWMATTMRSAAERAPEKLTVASLRSSVKVMFSMLLGGGLITWIFLTDGVSDIAFRLSNELQPIYMEQIAGLTLQQIGFLGSIFSFAVMFTPLLSGKISDRYGERVPIAIGFAMISVGFAIFLRSAAFAGFAGAWIVAGAGVGLLDPAYQSLISKVVPQKNLGMFTGLFRSSLGLISLPAPYIGAMLWERFTPRLPFTITAAAALLMVIPILLKFKLPARAEGAEEQELAEQPALTSVVD